MKVALHPQQPSKFLVEMVKEPGKSALVELSLRPSIDTKEPLLEEFSTMHAAVPIPIHLPGVVNSEESLRYHKKNWKYWAQRLVPRPSIRVFLILLVIAAISFVPALLSNPVPINDPTYNFSSDGSVNDSVHTLSGVGSQI